MGLPNGDILEWDRRHRGEVKFGSLGDHVTDYWGILETSSKLFFLNIENPYKELLNYMDIRKYDKEIQDIILHTLELYKPYEP